MQSVIGVAALEHGSPASSPRTPPQVHRRLPIVQHCTPEETRKILNCSQVPQQHSRVPTPGLSQVRGSFLRDWRARSSLWHALSLLTRRWGARKQEIAVPEQTGKLPRIPDLVRSTDEPIATGTWPSFEGLVTIIYLHHHDHDCT